MSWLSLQNHDAEHRDRRVVYVLVDYYCSTSFYKSIGLLVWLLRLNAEWITSTFSQTPKQQWIYGIGILPSVAITTHPTHQLLKL